MDGFEAESTTSPRRNEFGREFMVWSQLEAGMVGSVVQTQ
jgi:hypothetical protein